VARPLNDNDEGDKKPEGQKGPLNNEVEVHGCPVWLLGRGQPCSKICCNIVAGAAKGSGQSRRRTLEECGSSRGLMREGCGFVSRWALMSQRVDETKEEDRDG
jgi:hypothetical protein